MSKTAKIIFVVFFLAICCTPLALMPFVKSNAKIEKRELTEKPKYVENGKLNVNFSTQFESYFNDRLPLRSQILSAANLIKGGLLHSSSSNVISGKNGWLYFDNEKYAYMDAEAMSQSEIEACARTLYLIQERVEENGGKFTFVCAPNKSSVYGEYMPSFYEKARENNLTRLQKTLDAYGVSYTDLLGILTEHKSEGIYHKRDSHWNYLGALYGYNAIMDSLGRAHKPYSGVNYTYEKNWRGDLDKLLYPSGGFMDYQYSFDIAYDDFIFTVPADVQDVKGQLEIFMSDKEENDLKIQTRNKNAENTGIYMVRDSFGRALLPYMIDNYRQATFVRTDCPELNRVGEGMDMVYELVERNLEKLIGTAPFMFAPKREPGGYDELPVAKMGHAVYFAENLGYAIRIYGYFSDDTECYGPDYIRLEKDGESVIYEAFPIYESKLLSEKGVTEGSRGNGFSLMLDPAELSGEYTLSFITEGQELAEKYTVTF